MDNLMEYVTENSLIIIPTLYIIGYIIKNMEVVKDKYIPIILLPILRKSSSWLLFFLLYKKGMI